MAKRNTSIRINGRHYDVVTGAVLATESDTPVAQQSTTDVPEQTIEVTRVAPPPKPTSRAHTPAAHAQPKHGAPSVTLMRHVVAKPKPTLKRRTKVQSTTLAAQDHHLQLAHAAVVPKTAVHSVDHKRHARAQRIAHSPQISHFTHQISAATPVVFEEAVAAIDKAIVIPESTSPHSYRPDVIPVRVQRSASSDIFEQALLRATSHEQPAPETVAGSRRRNKAARSLRQRMVSYGAGAMAVLAIVGFFGAQHSDSLQFRSASNQAGFAATRPTYQPAGFSVASVQSSNGYIGLKYISPTTNLSFAITEKPSSWDSKTLLENLTMADQAQLYTTINKSGRTVYVYGRNQAAWVNNGVLYQILGNGALSTHEFGEIAASM